MNRPSVDLFGRIENDARFLEGYEATMREDTQTVAKREKAIHAAESAKTPEATDTVGVKGVSAQMMPGRLLVRPLNLVEKTKGGLHLPAHNAKSGSGANLNIDRLTMAEVVDCSPIFLDAKGTPLLDLPQSAAHWPIAKGSVVEFTRMRPWESVVEGLWIINSGDITRVWAGGVPEFFERFSEQ